MRRAAGVLFVGAILLSGWAGEGGCAPVTRNLGKAEVSGKAAPEAGAGGLDTRQVVTKLRGMYFARDYEGAVVEGRRTIGEFPDPGEARAWYLLSLASIFGETDGAIAEAERWVAARPEDPWARFALAGALAEEYDRYGEALPASRKAFRLAKSHPDFIRLHAEILSDSGRSQEALGLIDRFLPRAGNPADLLVLKGNILFGMSRGDPPNEAIRAGAFKLFEQARDADPSNVAAHFRPGSLLASQRHFGEALPLLRRAADLSPFSTDIHRRLWSALMGQPDVTPEKKRAEVESDIRTLLRARGDYPGALLAVSEQYGEMNLKDRRDEIDRRILKRFPDSLEAEWVLVNRKRRFSAEHSWEEMKNPRIREEYLKMARDFIARPHHRFEGLLGENYAALFLFLRDDPRCPVEELLRAIDGTLRYDRINAEINYPAAACALADRKAHLVEAERIVQEGFEVVRRAGARDQVYRYDSRKGQKEMARHWGALMTDASGWLHFNEGKMGEAEAELLRAQKVLKTEQNRAELNLFHLGRLYEAKGEMDRAEQFYAKGMAVPVPRDNPCVPAMQALYRKRVGSLEGFDAHMAKFSSRDRDARKRKILAERIAAPEAVQAFDLKALDGRRVSSEKLKGKIVVVNFWGVWCGWCLEEMPEIQKLHEKYRDDPEVAILTIDNDPSPETVRDWMKKKGFTFPVLLDDGYVGGKARVQAFPTTWFLDREGRRAFARDGWSKELVEEYGWRIEALRGAPPE